MIVSMTVRPYIVKLRGLYTATLPSSRLAFDLQNIAIPQDRRSKGEHKDEMNTKSEIKGVCVKVRLCMHGDHWMTVYHRHPEQKAGFVSS